MLKMQKEVEFCCLSNKGLGQQQIKTYLPIFLSKAIWSVISLILAMLNNVMQKLDC